MSAFVRLSRHRSWVFAITLLLAGCVAPALLLSPQGQLMWALLKPLVGLDPNEMNLLEQPLIKNRMQPLLGEHYDTAVTLLKTADKLQQEGPLFYLVSNHTPIPQLAEKAGFVWNSETNQMAVMLVTGGAPMVFAEQLNNQAAKVVPSWPADLADYADPVKLKQKALEKASNEASAKLGLSAEQQQVAGAVLGGANVKDMAKEQLEQQKQQLLNTAAAPVAAEINAAKQQVTSVKEQVKAATELKSNLKTGLENTINTQVNETVQQTQALKTEAKTQVEAQTKALTEPVTQLKNDVKTTMQDGIQQTQHLKTQGQAELTNQSQRLAAPITQLGTSLQTSAKNAVAPTATAIADVDDNDLAAEMAAEHASLAKTTTQNAAMAEQAARLKAANAAVDKAQAEVQAAAQLLAKANNPAEFASAKAKLDAASKTLEQAKALQQQIRQP